MEATAEIVNRVANSGLITLNLEDFRPKGGRILLDIKDQLFQGLILKEKDFREFLKNNDWEVYRGKFVAIICSADAIVPSWAYMLLASKLAPVAQYFIFGNLAELELEIFKQRLQREDFSKFENEKIVLKGCGDIPVAVYVEATRLLMPFVQKIMYGEPCSTVPIYKK